MPYKIDVAKIEEYVIYLRNFKKKLEKDLDNFDKTLKDAHSHWDDSNYDLIIKAKEQVLNEQKKLVEAIDKSVKKLKQLHEEGTKYLRRR